MRTDKNSAASPPLSAEQLIQQVKVVAVEETGNRAVFNRRHDPHILKWINHLGVDTVIQTIRDTDFKQMDYFYSEEDEEICMWEKMFLDRQLSDYERMKAEAYGDVSKEVVELMTDAGLVEEPEDTTWIADRELKKIQDRYGPRSPEAREFARKWDLIIK